MAKVTIVTKLWDMKAREWYKVHTVTFTITEESAKAAKDAFMIGSSIRSDDPKEYKKHIKFTTEMLIEDDNGNCIGGFTNY